MKRERVLLMSYVSESILGDKATLKQVREVIKLLGYERFQDDLKTPNQTDAFFWSEQNEYKSYVGIELYISKENDLIVDGEVWEYIEQDGEEEDEHGRYESHVFKRPSDNKYFYVTVAYCRYGYKDYGYEDYMQDLTAYEVEKKEIVKVEWQFVK